METIDTARTSPVRTAGPLKARGFAEFDQHVVLTCPVPSNRRARAEGTVTVKWAVRLDFFRLTNKLSK
jgi:hypothetical protein